MPGTRSIADRLFARDGSLWCTDEPCRESAEAFLGWLDLPTRMRPHLDDILEFAESCRRFEDAVILGMGGSSLCSEVIRTVFGEKEGFPRLHVLDSIIPRAIRDLESRTNPESTLFVVASKSGTTIEPLSLYQYFHDELTGRDLTPGDHFVAITDPGSRLEREAREKNFRRTFLNFEDVGGRYSALSFFGLVPAALSGIDISTIVKLAADELDAVRSGSATGLGLGEAIGEAWAAGRDKLVLRLPPGYEALGLWIEQLVAESTGKQEKGILPIVSEPLPRSSTPLSEDRLEVRWDGNELESTMAEVVLPSIAGPIDLARQFIIWEIATAVAGARLEVNPFDQPDVQAAKALTQRILGDETTPVPPETSSEHAMASAMRNASYVALLVYDLQSDALDQQIESFRREVVERRGVVTTSGYGPRYLHSTGQYHKGAGSGGVHIFVVPKNLDDPRLEIPGTTMTFGELALAQALGDIGALDARDRTVFVVDDIDILAGVARKID